MMRAGEQAGGRAAISAGKDPAKAIADCNVNDKAYDDTM